MFDCVSEATGSTKAANAPERTKAMIGSLVIQQN